LLIAAAISIALWFIPFAELLSYPFQLFVTFIHEGGHALAALLTGNSVTSLSVSTDTSGLTNAMIQENWLVQIFFFSAGYLGAMAFGIALLVLIRWRVSARVILVGCGAIVGSLTLIFGLIKPLIGLNSLSGIPFTLIAGTLLSVGLIALARFASPRIASFFVSFLAVQCVLNALLNLKTVFFLSSPFAPSVPNDAVSMANVTGVPAILWTIIWIAIAFGILWFAMRLYIVSRDARIQPDLPFEDSPAV
jgi:hypothetical protein